MCVGVGVLCVYSVSCCVSVCERECVRPYMSSDAEREEANKPGQIGLGLVINGAQKGERGLTGS